MTVKTKLYADWISRLAPVEVTGLVIPEQSSEFSELEVPADIADNLFIPGASQL